MLTTPVQHEIRYVQLAQKAFNAQQWDSCLYFHYILAHQYRLNNNSHGMANEWAFISITYLLKNDYEKAEASRKLTLSYLLPNETNNYTNLYFGIFYQKKENWKKSLQFLSSNKNSKLNTGQLSNLQELAICKNYYELRLYNEAKIALTHLLSPTFQKDPSCWYGIEYGNYLLGLIFWGKHDYPKAIKHFELSAHNFESSKLLNNEWMNCYQNILSAFWFTGQTDKSDYYFQRLTYLIEKYKLLNKFQFEYYTQKGLFYLSKLNKTEALDAYSKALESPGLKADVKAATIHKIIELCFSLGQFSKTITWAKQLPSEYLDDYTKIIIAHCYVKLGDIRNGQNWINTLNPSAYLNDSRLMDKLPKFYFDIKDYNKAEFFYKLALKRNLQTFGETHYSTSIAYSSLGYFYWIAKSDYLRSLDNYHKEIQTLTQGIKLADYFQLPDINRSTNDDYLARALNNKAEALCELAKQNPEKAEAIRYQKAGLANFELSVEVAHRYKMSLARDEQRLLFADLIKHRFPNIIKTCLDLYQKTGETIYLEKAFDYTEKSKASLLLSAVRGVNAYKLHQIPDALKHTEENIDKQTAMVSRQVSEEYKQPHPNLNKIDQFNNLLYLLKRQQNDLVQTLKKRYPTYYNARYNTNIVSARSLQKTLAPNEAVLQYSISKNLMVLFLITKDRFTYFSNPLDGHFFTDIEDFHKRISEFTFNDLNDSSVRAFAKLSNRLYTHLVKPAEPLLANKKLIIIPDDVLNQIPFEALVTKLPSTTHKSRYKDMGYLLKEHPLSYSYSGTLLTLNHESQNYQSSKLLAVAPEYSQMKFSNLLQKDIEAMRGDSTEIQPIPGTLAEAKKISNIFNGNTLLKKNASKTSFEKLARNYDILHLAMHGIINNEYPMFSKLVFATSKDTTDDEFLNTYEIYNLKLNAPLIVLSACNTGSGKLHTGEGIMSLARGFFTAGAKSLVMTLWSVADKTSSKLMGDFYNNLAHKSSISDALCKAKLDYINESDEVTAHPYFWAGYIAMGNSSSTFEPQKSYTDYFLWSGGTIAFTGILLVWRRRNNKKNSTKNQVL
ncbi:MAG: CHAT domain-containing protein [Bacteroidota bacterium]|nr:CHAT domain-containing protein [Bacteroidota bacterium]